MSKHKRCPHKRTYKNNSYFTSRLKIKLSSLSARVISISVVLRVEVLTAFE